MGAPADTRFWGAGRRARRDMAHSQPCSAGRVGGRRTGFNPLPGGMRTVWNGGSSVDDRGGRRARFSAQPFACRAALCGGNQGPDALGPGGGRFVASVQKSGSLQLLDFGNGGVKPHPTGAVLLWMLVDCLCLRKSLREIAAVGRRASPDRSRQLYLSICLEWFLIADNSVCDCEDFSSQRDGDKFAELALDRHPATGNARLGSWRGEPCPIYR